VTHDHFWNQVAAAYRRVGPPLRPSDEDAHNIEEAIRLHADAQKPMRVLLLGATPRLADTRWPDGTMMVAVDVARGFLRDVWPGDIPGRRRAVQGDWRSLPVRDAVYDVAIGDGSLNTLQYPDGMRLAARSVQRALGPKGLLVLRVFVRPDDCESPEALVHDAIAGRVETFHHFRFLLLMAMQSSARQGVAVRDVYRFWQDLGARRASLPSRPGWSHEDLQAIEPYSESSAVHTFPTLSECREVLSDHFEPIAIRPASYVLGDRCPIIVWRSRS
jgi:SAM-dependent methyltransferase